MIRKPVEMAMERRDQMRGGQGEVTVQHYFKPEEFGARMRLCARLTLPPGASIGEHEHLREDEIYLVLSGAGMLQEDGVRTRIQAGDAVLTGKGGKHALMNDGAEPLVIAAIIVLYP